MNVCVVGLGYWGSKVFEEYRQLRNEGELDAVLACDNDDQRLRAVNGADDYYGDLEAALSDADAIHLCTTNESHYPLASKTLDAGVDILVEKPLTADHGRAYDLVEQASECGQILQTGHIFRFANVVREVRDRYQAGVFGEVNCFTLRWTHRLDNPRDSDVLWDLLPHPVDILNFVTGKWPDRITGLTTAGGNWDRPESANIAFELGDATAVVQVSWADHVRRRSLEISGSKQSAVVDCVAQTLETYQEDEYVEHDVVDNNTIRREAQNFIRAIETGENTFNSAIVGARTVDAIDRIHGEMADE